MGEAEDAKSEKSGPVKRHRAERAGDGALRVGIAVVCMLGFSAAIVYLGAQSSDSGASEDENEERVVVSTGRRGFMQPIAPLASTLQDEDEQMRMMRMQLQVENNDNIASL